MPESFQVQDTQEIFALDIGTRSIIGVFGRKEKNRLHVLDIDTEAHDQRAMLDGQIEDIGRVADAARLVVQRIETRQKKKLTSANVAAAGRALRSERASFTLELDSVQQATDDIIGQLEAGAVSAAEKVITDLPDQQNNQFYMVGYTVSQYRVDGYPMSNLRGHSGKVLEADVIATFLPREVIESLYTVVSEIGLEVASLTLEPIASINAAIPKDIRLLNLALVDIGAGTSDIAVCRDGSVVGYTMATVAGDEVTELLMKKLLIDFQTAERMKMELNQDGPIRYTDILGLPHSAQVEELQGLILPATQLLAQEISSRLLELNGRAPSAVFLAGGGSKLAGLREKVAEGLQIDDNRVAIAGNHFERNAFSDSFDLNDPEYATPLGIAISAAMGLINDSYIVTLNGEPAKLFRSGVLVLKDILLMNGFRYRDLIGHSGSNLTVLFNGERLFFRGQPAAPPELLVNHEPAHLSYVVHAGDNIQFTPAQRGADAERTVADLVGESFRGEVTVNGVRVALTDKIHTGDEIWAESTITQPDPASQSSQAKRTVTVLTDMNQTESMETIEPIESIGSSETTETAAELIEENTEATEQITDNNKPAIMVELNDKILLLADKPDGEPYYLMDLLEYAGLDLNNLENPVELSVNGEEGQFSQTLHDQDIISIRSIER